MRSRSRAWTRIRSLIVAAAGAAIVVAVTAGCGDDRAGTHADDGVTVTIRDSGFKPAEVTIPVGQKVTWVHDASSPQSVETVHTHPHPVDLHTLRDGDAKSHVFRHPGRYDYFSIWDMRKIGVVVVRPKQ